VEFSGCGILAYKLHRNQGDTARAVIRRFAFKGIASDVAEYSIKMGIRSGIQDFCSVASSANKLQYKQWNPGILEAPPWQDEYSVLSKNMWKFTLKDLYSYHSSNQFIDKSWKKIGKSSRVVGAQQCCNLSDPLLGGKQCFLGAVMSCPCIMALWAQRTWAVGLPFGLVMIRRKLWLRREGIELV
jgi:hypothetical protein